MCREIVNKITTDACKKDCIGQAVSIHQQQLVTANTTLETSASLNVFRPLAGRYPPAFAYQLRQRLGW